MRATCVFTSNLAKEEDSMKSIGCILCLTMVLGLHTSPGWGYEEMTVANGGTLQGVVTLVGAVPKPKGYNLVTLPDPVYCGRISTGTGWRLLQPFVIGPDGGFKNVVIYIEEITQGKAFPYVPPRIEAIDCTFEPYITIVRDGFDVEVVNMDPVLHDIQGYETSKHGARVLFNVPLPMSPHIRKKDFLNGRTPGDRAGKLLIQRVAMGKKRNLFVMQCGFHAYMESWGFAVQNPYYALTDKHGSYAITDIPPGTWRVQVWHPMVSKAYTVTINPGETTDLPIAIKAPTGRLYANEMSEGTRFGVELLGETAIEPTVERQTY